MHCDLKFPKKLAGYLVWTFYVNDFDGVMDFECQDGNIVTGIGAYHSTRHYDRRYKFRCTFLKWKRRGNCSWGNYTNFRALWVETAPLGRYMTGVKSDHSNPYG